MTEKTELAIFLLKVVNEFEFQNENMWDDTLTIQDRLSALRLVTNRTGYNLFGILGTLREDNLSVIPTKNVKKRK